MRFLVDAQLPRSLALLLVARGHDAIHTLDLPRANRTADSEISRLADAEDRVVISKDKDFRQSYTIIGSPLRLLLVTTGNVSPAALRTMVDGHLEAIVEAFAEATFVELRAAAIIIHSDRWWRS